MLKYLGYVNESLYTGNIDFRDIPNSQPSYWVQEITCKFGSHVTPFRSFDVCWFLSNDCARKFHLFAQWFCVLCSD